LHQVLGLVFDIKPWIKEKWSNITPFEPRFNLSHENERLRKENRLLREEGEILKKATEFFAKQKP
tara:strand:+ start:363 stop:557 length:195 start_codon:yes stop_codon:yes gene_type:complete